VSRSYRDEMFDKHQAELGLPSLSELSGTGEHDRHAQMQRDREARDRNLNVLPPLGGRAPITSDWMCDAPGYSDLHGGRSPEAPTIAEQLARFDETEQLIIKQGGEPMPERKPVPGGGAELAEIMLSEFRSRHARLAADTDALEAAAQRVIERDGFQWERRSDFYDRVANELGDNGRTEVMSPRSQASPTAKPEAKPEDMIAQLQRRQRTDGIF
jgi:hypothetical protein